MILKPNILPSNLNYKDFAGDNGCHPGGVLYEYGARVWDAAIKAVEEKLVSTTKKETPCDACTDTDCAKCSDCCPHCGKPI